MLVFLYGENTYLTQKKTQEIVANAQKAHKNGLFIRYVDCAKESDQSIIDGIWQADLLARQRLTVLKNTFQNAGFKEYLAQKGDVLSKIKETFIFYEEGYPPARDAFFIFLQKEAKTHDFKALQGQTLERWAADEFGKYRTGIEADALSLLLNSGPSDLWLLENEIKKLVAFRKGQKVKLQDVVLLCRRQTEGEIFKTLDALTSENKKKAAELLHRQVQWGDSPLYILSMVGYQLRNMLAVKDLLDKGRTQPAVIKETGLHPYVAQKTINQVGRFSLADLKKIYQGLLRVDVDLKTGKLVPEIALDISMSRIN